MVPGVRLSIRQNIAMLALVIAMLAGGTWSAVKLTTDHLLYADATAAAQNWARFLTDSVPDLEEIAAGEPPSAASVAFFETARKSAQVFRFEIFNRGGYLQLVSDREKVVAVDVSEFNGQAAHAMQIRQPAVGAMAGRSPGQPAYFALAYIPVLVDGRGIAVVAAYVDQTAQRDSFYNTFLVASAALCLLTTLSFAVPAVAWFRRTKENQRADRRIRFLAHHDILTGLINRGYLTEQLNAVLTTPANRGVAVHFLDCDRFKEVNDTLGHDGGDFLLKTIAERLRLATRTGDLVARLGGDEFVVVQTNIGDRQEAEAFAQRLAVALAAPVRFKDHTISATASIGIAVAPDDGETSDRLLKSADLALYRAKADGRNCFRCFTPAMDTELNARLEIEALIRDAVENSRFELHYQPLYEVSRHCLIGFEALIRLRREDATLVPPSEFIAVAEDMRLIDQIGAWVLREACRTALTWPRHLTVAVNLSPLQFAGGRKVSEVVAEMLEQTGLESHRLELEITETALLGDGAFIMSELGRLKELGVAIAIDDFGTGYSSLSYLWRFPFDKIKIDRSFIQASNGSSLEAETVLRTIVSLGRQLHMRVTVEGVETARQAAFLDENNGDQVQGFYFGRPGSGSELAAIIEADLRLRSAVTVPEPRGLAPASARANAVAWPIACRSGDVIMHER